MKRDGLHDLHRIMVHGGAEAVIAAHVPPEMMDRVRLWIAQQNSNGRWSAPVSFETKLARNHHKAMQIHWAYVKRLWHAIPAGPSAAQSDGIEYKRRQFSSSISLGPSARFKASNELVTHLSAVAARQPAFLFSGWERIQFEYRMIERMRRHDEMSALQEALQAEDALHQAAAQISIIKEQQKQRDIKNNWPVPWPS